MHKNRNLRKKKHSHIRKKSPAKSQYPLHKLPKYSEFFFLLFVGRMQYHEIYKPLGSLASQCTQKIKNTKKYKEGIKNNNLENG
jgi:hypothetical protein